LRNNPKILFITFEYGEHISGGIGRVLNGLVPFIQKNIDLNILLFNNYRIFQFTQIYKTRNNKWVKRYFSFRPKMLIELIQNGEFDIIHIFHVSGIYLQVLKLIKKNFPQIKIVYSCHSIAKYEFNIRNIPPDFLYYENFILNHIDHLHLLNQTSLKYFQESYPSIAEKIPYSIIPNGIDSDTFQKQDLGFKRKMQQLINNKYTVLCMSRWSWGKGLEYLLDAIPEVIKHCQNIQFVIAGKRIISWEYRYIDYIKIINNKIAALDDYVIPLSWLNDKQRNTLFTFADIWVMPSLLEYFPYSILEPMGAKIPIISSNIDCVRELLSDYNECLFYDSKDPHQLADKILTLVQDPGLGKKLAENAFYKAKEYFEWDYIADMYVKMYKTVINQSGNKSGVLVTP
jgi:glycosyltransferase involved in cell wall biosynthesis